MQRFTLVVTSCQRHDLLKRTLESFIDHVEEEPLETVIVEDSELGPPDWFEGIKRKLGWKVQWLSNGTRRGQIYTADRAMSEVKTERLFWCEDDWEFTQGGFIGPSHEILDRYPKVITVGLRSDWNHPLVAGDVSLCRYCGGKSFACEWCDITKRDLKIAQPYWGGGWGGFMFNPGMRRLSDYQRLGSFGRHVGYGISGLSHEQHFSKQLLDQGYRIAVLPGHCHHIGDGRSRAIEFVTTLPKILIAVPACRKLDYGKWESGDSPHFNPANPAYGTNIHISGENNRIAAVRNTWWQDVRPFARHVDARFFYGNSFVGGTLPDEVVLSVEDDYAHLPQKTQAICRWAIENDYDYMLKVDDDSFVFVDRAIQEILKGRFEYGGCYSDGLCTGGPGYWLSKRAMKMVAHAGAPDHWAEDMWVGRVVTNAGIRAESLPHYPGYKEHWFDINKVPADAVVVHAVRPEDMVRLYSSSPST